MTTCSSVTFEKDLPPRHAQHLPGFGLAAGHRLDAAAVNFRKIARVVDHESRHGRRQPPARPGGPGVGQPSRPGPMNSTMTCSISGVPRMIHTKVLTAPRSGAKRLMDPKATMSPSGSANTSCQRKQLDD